MEKQDKNSFDRRSFLKVAAGSGAALVASAQAMSAQQSGRKQNPSPQQGVSPMPITDSEKARRRRLLKAHYDVENSHDMSGIMATFSPDGEMHSNR
ncbi:MAG: twin-arginine translocation signal domain-containing protein, partial [Acidobacteria bacterium]|nr:twin-arginine translocation signal domain-containing protein [Acidobacteriota bacterium]